MCVRACMCACVRACVCRCLCNITKCEEFIRTKNASITVAYVFHSYNALLKLHIETALLPFLFNFLPAIHNNFPTINYLFETKHPSVLTSEITVNVGSFVDLYDPQNLYQHVDQFLAIPHNKQVKCGCFLYTVGYCIAGYF